MGVKENLDQSAIYAKTFVKWLFFASVVGILCGLIGAAFYTSIDVATHLRQENPWLLFLLPFGGLAIVACYRLAGVKEPRGTDMVISSIRSSEKIPFKMLPLIFAATTLTHLFGGSAGRAGAALQIGGSLGSNLGRGVHLDERDIRLITMCGMSSLFAALFGTPLTAALFAMEVISVGVIYYTAIVPCILGALLGYAISLSLGMHPVRYALTAVPALTVDTAVRVILLSVCCALLSIVYCAALHQTARLFKRYIPNAYLRIFVGGCLVAAATLLVGSYDYNGTGMDVITRAVEGYARPEAFLWKILFTAVSLGAGFKGGEIMPTFFVGATFGNVLGGLLGLNPCFGAAVGIIALFCGVVNCPIASIILSVELFGSSGILLFALAASVSYMLSGYYSLYGAQKIVYSKIHPEYINRDTK